MKFYDTALFLEIIETEGVLHIKSDQRGDVRVHLYRGLTGQHVFIDVSDEEIPYITCRDHLRRLGLDRLIRLILT